MQRLQHESDSYESCVGHCMFLQYLHPVEPCIFESAGRGTVYSNPMKHSKFSSPASATLGCTQGVRVFFTPSNTTDILLQATHHLTFYASALPRHFRST